MARQPSEAAARIGAEIVPSRDVHRALARKILEHIMPPRLPEDPQLLEWLTEQLDVHVMTCVGSALLRLADCTGDLVTHPELDTEREEQP